jgi:hypothetical protein
VLFSLINPFEFLENGMSHSHKLYLSVEAYNCCVV